VTAGAGTPANGRDARALIGGLSETVAIVTPWSWPHGAGTLAIRVPAEPA
jgi:hypothetical protein